MYGINFNQVAPKMSMVCMHDASARTQPPGHSFLDEYMYLLMLSKQLPGWKLRTRALLMTSVWFVIFGMFNTERKYMYMYITGGNEEIVLMHPGHPATEHDCVENRPHIHANLIVTEL